MEATLASIPVLPSADEVAGRAFIVLINRLRHARQAQVPPFRHHYNFDGDIVSLTMQMATCDGSVMVVICGNNQSLYAALGVLAMSVSLRLRTDVRIVDGELMFDVQGDYDLPQVPDELS